MLIRTMASLNTYDVVIVGAGPAGAILAYLLAKEGVDVLILEKKNLPRYKPCAGGLTRRALAALPFEVKEVVEDEAAEVPLACWMALTMAPTHQSLRLNSGVMKGTTPEITAASKPNRKPPSAMTAE